MPSSAESVDSRIEALPRKQTPTMKHTQVSVASRYEIKFISASEVALPAVESRHSQLLEDPVLIRESTYAFSERNPKRLQTVLVERIWWETD